MNHRTTLILDTVHPLEKGWWFPPALANASATARAAPLPPDKGNGRCNDDFVQELNSRWVFTLVLSSPAPTAVSELSPLRLVGGISWWRGESRVVTDGQVVNP